MAQDGQHRRIAMREVLPGESDRSGSRQGLHGFCPDLTTLPVLSMTSEIFFGSGSMPLREEIIPRTVLSMNVRTNGFMATYRPSTSSVMSAIFASSRERIRSAIPDTSSGPNLSLIHISEPTRQA